MYFFSRWYRKKSPSDQLEQLEPHELDAQETMIEGTPTDHAKTRREKFQLGDITNESALFQHQQLLDNYKFLIKLAHELSSLYIDDIVVKMEKVRFEAKSLSSTDQHFAIMALRE